MAKKYAITLPEADPVQRYSPLLFHKICRDGECCVINPDELKYYNLDKCECESIYMTREQFDNLEEFQGW